VVELTAVGGWITLRINGQILLRCFDTSVTSPGGAMLATVPGNSGAAPNLKCDELSITDATTLFSMAGGSSSAVSRFFAPDSNDVLRYTFDESAPPYANSGTGGAANLTLAGGSVASRPGLFPNVQAMGRGVAFRGVSQDRLQGGAAIEPALPITVSMWWFQLAASNGCNIFSKLYRPAGSFTAPFFAWTLGINDAVGTAVVQVTVGGVATTLLSTNIFDRVVTGQWNLLVATYDGATIKLYVNGNLANSVAQAGAIDYGTHGPYTTEQEPPGAGTITGILDEVRVANVLRDATWVENYWKTGMLLD
jgi:hypothetical protein